MFDVDIILDCDIVSTIAKIDRIDLLFDLFEKSRLFIPDAVYVELLEAEKMGFEFPKRVFNSRIELATLSQQELKDFEDIVKNLKIHSGEAEGIAIARRRGGVFLTNDRVAVKFCEQEDVAVLDLKDVLKLVARNRIVDENEMLQIINNIEKKDNTVITETEEIFEEY